MSKKDSSKEGNSDNSAPPVESAGEDSDVIQPADVVPALPEPETAVEADSETAVEADSEPAIEADFEPAVDSKQENEAIQDDGKGVAPAPRRPWLGLFNLLLIIALAAAAGYYWWLQQQSERQYRQTIAELEQQIAGKASSASIAASLSPLRSEIGSLEGKMARLEDNQQGLQLSSKKLFELFGRDRNDWQLSEVEYLMRVAQHKLILQNDFEGAALTLQAASDKIAQNGDPGLLPVRIKISEEIAQLKTRARPDLVGATLILAQLGRQARALKPGFDLRVEVDMAKPATPVDKAASLIDRLRSFVDSLVKVRRESSKPSEIEATAVDVGETLEDNLKLARWSVLERDERQYRQLIEQSLRLFREFYSLDDAANHDFYTQLQSLEKLVINPEKPDIIGSLQLLQLILSKRENAPVLEAPASGEAQ